jgi:hypothetical protein
MLEQGAFENHKKASFLLFYFNFVNSSPKNLAMAPIPKRLYYPFRAVHLQSI